jgi:hypothetical protein
MSVEVMARIVYLGLVPGLQHWLQDAQKEHVRKILRQVKGTNIFTFIAASYIKIMGMLINCIS